MCISLCHAKSAICSFFHSFSIINGCKNDWVQQNVFILYFSGSWIYQLSQKKTFLPTLICLIFEPICHSLASLILTQARYLLLELAYYTLRLLRLWCAFKLLWFCCLDWKNKAMGYIQDCLPVIINLQFSSQG